MSELSVIADYGDLCGEGPLWDDQAGMLYWTDLVGRRFYRWNPKDRKHEILKQNLEINGFTLNQPGGFVVVNNSGIWLWDGADSVQPIAREVDGIPCQMNDCIADPVGRMFVGTCFYDPKKNYRLGHLMRVDTSGRVTIVDEGIHLANGLGFSPDCTILYFSDSAVRRIYAYDYDVKSGDIRNRRVLVAVPLEEGIPDGMTVDAAGFLWSAQWYGSCLVRYDPDGKVERRVQTPAKQTSSVAFGGTELTDIFITSAAQSEIAPIMPPGYDPYAGYFGGCLYHINLGIQGKREFRTSISI